jgi:hypothetical protein
MGASVELKTAPPVAARLADAIDIGLEHASGKTRQAATLRRIAVFLAVLAGYTVLTALFFWQVLPHLSSALLGPPEDNLNDFWNSWYALQTHSDGFFFTHLIRYPEGAALYYHSFAYPQIFAVWVLSKIFGTSLPTLIQLQNLTILASFPLAGAGAFYLCRHLRGGTIGSAAGGFIFAFSPWHVAQTMHHALGAGVEFLPLFVLCYLRASNRQSYSWLAGASVFLALSALCSWYYLFYCFYFLAFHSLYLRVHEHRWPHGWRLGALLLCFGGAMLPLSPLILPLVLYGRDGAYLPGSNYFVADLLSYITFPPAHLLSGLSARLYNSFTGNDWEIATYLGLVNLVLLGWGFWRAREGDRRVLWYAMGGMIFFAVLASGDALHWQGRTLPVPMPDIVLSKLPFFANVRAPARAIVFVYLFMGVGVAAAIAASLKDRRTILAGAVLSFVLALALIDFFPAHLETTAVSCSPTLSLLARDRDRNFGVLDLPYGYAERNFYMTQQACHGRPIAQGTVSRQLAATLADRLNVQDFAAQRRQLVAARIKYILLHHPVGTLFGWTPQYDGDPENYRRAYPVAADGKDVTILRVY